MKLLIADDHTIVRSGLRAELEEHLNQVQIDEASDGAQVLDMLAANDYDLAIFDYTMPEKTGLELLQHIQQNDIVLPVIILTMHHEKHYFEQAFAAGALGYLLKEDASEELIKCVHSVSQGVEYISARLADFAKTRAEMQALLPEIVRQLDSLTPTEKNTLRLVAQNKSTKEIADMLFVTPKSVENYRSRICKKLALDGSNNSLLAWALEYRSYID